jgi:ubiquinone/menaquinone biosynthesis C-methylase UbiE
VIDGIDQAENDRTPEVWDDEMATWYAEHWGDHPSNAMTVELAKLRLDDSVLDVGCGSGTAVRAAAVRASQGWAIGIDPSPAMIRIATDNTVAHPARDRIEYREGSAESIPLPDGAVTTVLVINSLHHWQDLEIGLREVQRVLVPGGRLLITEEALPGDRCGHGEKPLDDPSFVASMLEASGFLDLVVGTQKEEDVELYYFCARRP